MLAKYLEKQIEAGAAWKESHRTSRLLVEILVYVVVVDRSTEPPPALLLLFWASSVKDRRYHQHACGFAKLSLCHRSRDG